MDFGAQYIHGQDENPLYQLALQHDLIVSPASSTKVKDTNKSGTAELYGNEFRTENGDLVPRKTVRDVNEFLEDAYEKCNNGCIDNASRNESMGHRFETRFEEYLQSRDDSENDLITKRGVFDWRTRWELHDNGCPSLFDAAKARYENYSGDYFIDVPGGFQSIFHALLNDIPPECVRTCTPVSKINWRGDENSNRSPKCTVETNHGECVNCYYVIVTVSLGVLQTNMNTLFRPSLPQSRKEAISRSGFGNAVKIFLTWTEPFWESSFEGIQFVWTCSVDGRKDKLPKKTLTKKVYCNDKNMTEVLILYKLHTDKVLRLPYIAYTVYCSFFFYLLMYVFLKCIYCLPIKKATTLRYFELVQSYSVKILILH